jgi:hypothetical protein
MDNAPEFVKLGKKLKFEGVTIEPTETYTPSQNGTAERLNRTLITKARSILAAANLPQITLGGGSPHSLLPAKSDARRRRSYTKGEMDWQEAKSWTFTGIWVRCLSSCPTGEARQA